MIDRENISLGWLLVGVFTLTVVFNGIALALNSTLSTEADTATSVTTAQQGFFVLSLA